MDFAKNLFQANTNDRKGYVGRNTAHVSCTKVMFCSILYCNKSCKTTILYIKHSGTVEADQNIAIN